MTQTTAPVLGRAVNRSEENSSEPIDSYLQMDRRSQPVID
jgi:hypothetical protein